jgi:hypothetical protein
VVIRHPRWPGPKGAPAPAGPGEELLPAPALVPPPEDAPLVPPPVVPALDSTGRLDTGETPVPELAGPAFPVVEPERPDVPEEPEPPPDAEVLPAPTATGALEPPDPPLDTS